MAPTVADRLARLLRLTPAEMRLDAAIADLVLQYGSEGPYESTQFLPREADYARVASLGGALRLQIDELPPSIFERADSLAGRLGLRVEGAPAPILAGHLIDLLNGLDCALVDDQRHPERYLAGLTRFVTAQVWEERRARSRRLATLRERLEPLPDLLAAVDLLARRAGPPTPQTLAETGRSLATVLTNAARAVAAWSGERDALRFADQLTEWANQVTARIAQWSAMTARSGEQLPLLEYPDVLRRRHGVEIGELCSNHEDEIARCYDQFRGLARVIESDADPVALLRSRSPAYPSAAAMFRAAHDCLIRARHAATAYIALPPGEICRVSPMPELIRASYPWGGAYGPSVARGLLWGKWYCNQANFRAVTRGWIQMMAIHECYPGHHAHRVKAVASDLPLTFRFGRLAGSTPLSEGIAHRAETQLQSIYDDPIFPMFVAYRRLHTAVRIKADLDLHHSARPRDEAVALYQRYLGFDPVSASGQVRYQELHPGYMTCYYHGCRQLERWQAELPLSDAEFTEATFSIGWVSLATTRRILEGLARPTMSVTRA